MSELMYVTTDAIVPSAHNPRRTHDAVADAELLASVRASGILQALLVRELPGIDRHATPRFELIDGFRRWSAAREAGLGEVPCMVQAVKDEEARAQALATALHRKNLAPLDEARALKTLLGSHTPAQLATLVSKDVRYVWDRLRLTELVPEAQALMDRGILPEAQAVMLSKLKPADQERAIGDNDPGPAFEVENGFDFEEDLKDYQGDRLEDFYAGYRAITPTELARWIRDHVRFDPAHAVEAEPLDFGEPLAEIAEAQREDGTRLIAITYDRTVHEDAKAEGERTYTAGQWERADGAEDSEACEHAVLGMVVCGPRYREVFPVCVKRSCAIHRPKPEADGKPTAGAKQAAARDTWQAREEKRRADQAKREAAWKTVRPQLVEAIVQATATTKTTDTHLADAIERRAQGAYKRVVAIVGRINAKTFGRALVLADALAQCDRDFCNEYGITHVTQDLKLAFNLTKAMAAATKASQAAEKTRVQAPGKAAAKARKGRKS